jgi:ABC-type phosphate/phosphonate transport system substrate-binding protein
MKNDIVRLVSKGILWSAFGSCATWSTAQAANVTLMVEPTYNPEQAAEVYKPLVDYLNATTGHKVSLVTSRNYHFFWRDVRQNVPIDLMFAEAHISDYRAKRFQTEPIVRTAERASYTLLASDQLSDASLDSLVGKSIVTMPSPSLGFALLLEFFPNPVAQPNILSSAASWRDGVEIVFAGEADAAIVPTWLKDQYPNLIPIKASRDFAGPAISASPSLDATVKQDIKTALLKLHDNPDYYSVLNELGATQFVETNAAEYDGAEQMLKGFYGYQ